MIKIALDVMGYENDLKHALNAAIKFQEKHKNNLKIILVGDKEKILNSNKNIDLDIVHTDVFVTQEDTILKARRKSTSSMQICANMLKNKEVDGMLSAGSTPIFVYTTYSTLGLLEGVKQIGFMPSFPTVDSSFFNMIDVGASINVTSEDLIMFAIMALEYAKQTKTNPSIGVLNIGTEDHKGHEYHKETHEYFKNSDFNYKGFVEPKNLLYRPVDIVVTDGFTGNIALKAMEGTAQTLSKMFKMEYKKPHNILAALLSLRIIKNVSNKFDYKNYAGAFVLGLNEVAVKTHGSADEKQFYSALRMLYECLENKVLNNIKEAVKTYYGTTTKQK